MNVVVERTKKKTEKDENEYNTIKNRSDQINKMRTEIDKRETKLLNELGNLYNEMSKQYMSVVNVQSSINKLASYNNTQEYNYLNNMTCPERAKGCKIPSAIPIPSCSFQLHNCVTLRTNNSGNLALFFNPVFLCNTNISHDIDYKLTVGANPTDYILTPQNMTTLWINNNETLTGSAANYNWSPINIGQMLPPVYDQYRLVSASLVVKYIGRLDIASGVIGGAVIFDENKYIGTNYSIKEASGGSSFSYSSQNSDLAKYGNFDLAMDSYYHRENLTIEGIRELYFPLDNSFEEYTKTLDGTNMNIDGYFDTEPRLKFSADQDYYKSGFNWLVYALGAPANSSCFKVDIYCNYECLPNAEFLNYLPLSMSPYHINNSEKNEANRTVQQKPIMKSSEIHYDTDVPDCWLNMKKKFGNSVPGIKKLLSEGLINAIPSIKPGIALAGAMIENMDMEY